MSVCLSVCWIKVITASSHSKSCPGDQTRTDQDDQYDQDDQDNPDEDKNL